MCRRRESRALTSCAQMGSELVPLDHRWILEHREAAEPFVTNIVVALREREALAVMSVVQIGEVKKQSHEKRLPDRAELLHKLVIEAGEVPILQRCNDRPRERHGARLDRIGRRARAAPDKFPEKY